MKATTNFLRVFSLILILNSGCDRGATAQYRLWLSESPLKTTIKTEINEIKIAEQVIAPVLKTEKFELFDNHVWKNNWGIRIELSQPENKSVTLLIWGFGWGKKLREVRRIEKELVAEFNRSHYIVKYNKEAGDKWSRDN